MLMPLLSKSYLQTINNSVGSVQYRNFYVLDTDTGETRDILENGNLSCAIFVSNILHMFSNISKLIDAPHVTIISTIKDIERSGWYNTWDQNSDISNIKPGAIIHWEKIDFGIAGYHEHIGFYVGNSEAISNDSRQYKITKHSYNFNGTRKIEKIYWHAGLDK